MPTRVCLRCFPGCLAHFVHGINPVWPENWIRLNSHRFFIAGGAGFIGSHFTDRLLCDRSVEAVTLYDNFSSGREWHYAHHQGDARLRVIHGDVKDLLALERVMAGHDVVIHLA